MRMMNLIWLVFLEYFLTSQVTNVEKFEAAVERLPEFIESASKQWDDVQHLHNDKVSAELNVLLLADDFAGNLIMHWFGRNRPSKDYYVYQI